MRKSAVYLMLTILLASSFPLNASADASDDIPTNAEETGVHDSLVDALGHAGLVATLQGAGPFTVFAPTDQAFTDAGINLTDFDTDAENDTLTDILLYHVFSGQVPASAVTDGMLATMANGDKVKFGVNSGTVTVGGATVTTADVPASNGIIHIIDTVLMPPVDIPATAQTTGIHNSLVDAVIQADLLATLQGTGPFTLFAPTDQAFSDAGIDLAALDTPAGKATLSDILLYHVISGEVPASAVTDCMDANAVNGQPLSFTVGATVMVNDATVVETDVVTSNGLIHVIDKVLTPSDSPKDIPRTAQCTGIHNSLVSAVVQAELLATLQGTGPFTLFAPTDQAFTDAGIDLAALDTPEGKAALSDILLYHVVSGEVPSSAVTECLSATTVNGNPISFTVGDGVMVNDATVIMADVATSNGIIHVIDKVLTPIEAPNDIPRTAQCTGIHNSLVSAVVQAELLTTLQGTGPFTLFAPTDQAFTDAGIDLAALDTPEGKAALSDILLYHVIAGAVPSSAVTECLSATTVNGNPISFTVTDGVMVNDATVTMADVATSNGIIHVIDKVLTPTSTPSDIPRTAQCTGVHNSLVASVIQAELLPILQGDGPFTVFAPTDQAFTDAGIDLVALDTPEGKAALSDILLYHVVAGEVPASAVTDCMSAETVNGNPLSFTVGDGVMVNGANVTATDVATSNGIIHVIDKVLTPTLTPNDIPRTAQCTGIHNSLVAAVIQAELLETLQGPGPFTVFAPTDQAFADAGIDLAALDTPEGKATLADILLYHVVLAEVASSGLSDGMTTEAANGDYLTFDLTSGVMVNDANVISADVATSNGVIHVIDKVLMPLGDITDIAAWTGIHTSLVAALIQAELVETLQGDGPFTVFAPTDQAFIDAGIDLADLDTPEGKEALANILLYHVVQGEVPSSAVTDCMIANTSAVTTSNNTASLNFAVGALREADDGGVMVNDPTVIMVNNATVLLGDVTASNGVIHVIDKVLTPELYGVNNIHCSLSQTGLHDSLLAALIQAELIETLEGEGPFTVFAPTDLAFAEAGIDLAALDTPEGKETLANILLYHVVSANVPYSELTDCMSAVAANGQTLSFTLKQFNVGASETIDSIVVNSATVNYADYSTTNGVIHSIDKVLTPTDNPNDIPRTAQCTGIHNTLVAAVIQAELLVTLEGEGPFTLFAPTDQAFADAGIDLAALDTPEGKATLTDILLYHVYYGSVLSGDIGDGMTIQMVNGDNLTVWPTDANVAISDVMSSNGVIHVIDKVLMPPEVVEDTSDDAKGSDDDDSNYTIWIIISLAVIIACAGAVLFMRSRGIEEDVPKSFAQHDGLMEFLQTVNPEAYATQSTQAVQAVQPVQSPGFVPQAVAEPVILQQWTDEGGHTWRSMDNGDTLWWNGTDWQKYA